MKFIAKNRNCYAVFCNRNFLVLIRFNTFQKDKNYIFMFKDQLLLAHQLNKMFRQQYSASFEALLVHLESANARL